MVYPIVARFLLRVENDEWASWRPNVSSWQIKIWTELSHHQNTVEQIVNAPPRMTKRVSVAIGQNKGVRTRLRCLLEVRILHILHILEILHSGSNSCDLNRVIHMHFGVSIVLLHSWDEGVSSNRNIQFTNLVELFDVAGSERKIKDWDCLVHHFFSFCQRLSTCEQSLSKISFLRRIKMRVLFERECRFGFHKQILAITIRVAPRPNHRQT